MDALDALDSRSVMFIIRVLFAVSPLRNSILSFIVKGVSKQKVVNYMNEEDLSSKVTTLAMIDALLDMEILIDPSNRRYQSTLEINPEFNFYGLLLDAIYYKIQDVVKALKPLELIKDGQFKVETRMDKEKGKDKVEVTLSSNPNSDKLAVAATAAAKTKPTVTH